METQNIKTTVNIYSNSTGGSITHYSVREWTVDVYAVQRSVLESKLSEKQKNALSKSGVYILVNERQAYIGKSQNILKRWKAEHLGDKDKAWFDCAYAITDLRTFSATDLNALEYLFWKKATEVGSFEIKNASAIKKESDYLKDENFYNIVFSNVNLLLNSIYRGHRVFGKINTENTQTPNNNSQEETLLNEKLQNKIFTMKKSGCFGQLKKVKEGWLLLKGAQAIKRDYENFVKNKNAKKAIYYSSAYLDNKLDENLKTTEDILFSTPSTPAAALMQGTANGWTVWKDENGKKLDDYRQGNF
ncbi:MAG: DUF4357 domain-containing protein [Neisseriaceae bacterium]|nr:DUF4357 domain-containing protein [Neisseriaceae bacterium]